MGRIPDLPKEADNLSSEKQTSGKKFGVELSIRTDKTRQTEVRWERAFINSRVNKAVYNNKHSILNGG